MIVITIMGILMAIAAGNYQRSVLRSKEAALKQDLFVMRNAIEQFTLDKEAAPQSLDELVSAGYLRAIPKDPITNAVDWRPIYDDVLLTPEQV
ncbi:MAG: type IV pilin protein, partial [Candidatus Acidiferrales bacterium]